MTRLLRLDRQYPGLVPDLIPEGSLAQHAALALHEHWSIALFSAWATIARQYVADHYAPHPQLSPRGAIQRRHTLEEALQETLRNLADAEGEP